MKKFLKLFTPPILLLLYDKLQENFFSNYKNDPDFLFDGDDKLFKRTVSSAQTYGEYGCGKSTNWILKNLAVPVYSVDTSREWVDFVTGQNHTSNNLFIKAIDLGEIGDWGRPISYIRSSYFREYTDWIWTQKEAPDVVLIDGRFRVCCFLTSLKFASEGTKILFDDYTDRPHYHIVEEFLPRSEVCGRQCLFEVPEKSILDSKKLDLAIENFRYVMD